MNHSPQIVSVIMPAHNEGRVIGRALQALTQGARDGELEIIVVANACTDDTATVARSFGAPVRVIETDVASKSNALNLGERDAGGFPRVYVDGDVILPIESLRLIIEHLRSGKALATGPLPRWDLTGASSAVRAFYEIDGRLPSSKVGIGGSGVYALSEKGRRRFTEFPRITADDAFVRGHFKPIERPPTVAAYSIVTPPRVLAGVIAIKTRSHFGNYELGPRLPMRGNHEGGEPNWPVLLSLTLRPGLWVSIAVYVYTKLLAKARAYWRFRKGRAVRWERDETSRMARAPDTPTARAAATTPTTAATTTAI
jgi:glycosyltransferase involved in cell wall biosynthesis